MGFFEGLGRTLTAALGDRSLSYTLPLGDTYSTPRTGDPAQQLKAYDSWVYAAATARAKAVAKAKLRLYKPDGSEIETHPFLDLWQKPCEAWHGYPFRVVAALHMYLSGNAYWWTADNGLKVPAALWPLRPDFTEVIPGKRREDGTQRFIDGYRFTGSSGQVEFPVEEVVHLKLPNPYSNYYGMGVVEAARRAVDLNRYMNDYALAAFRNNATPKSVVMIDRDAPPDQQEAAVAMLGDQFKGIANAGRTAVISNAIKDIKRISMSPEEMDYLEGKAFSRDEIFALFGVHRSKAGMADDINRANAEAADYTFANDVVSADLLLFEDAINADLLPRYDPRITARFDDVVPADRDRAIREAEMSWTTGLAQRDEARVLIGMDEIGGQAGKVYSIPFSVTLTGESTAVAGPRGRVSQVAAFGRQAQAVGSLLSRHETAIKAAMESYFRSQRTRVTGALRNELAAFPTVARYGVDEADEQQRLYDLLYPLLLAAALAGFLYVNKLSGTDVKGEPEAEVAARAAQVAQIITATTVAQIIAAIESAETKAEALAGIQAVFDRAIGSRAALIGRVEASTMVHFAIRIGMSMAGFAYKQWQTVQDDRVEETCAENESYGAVPIDSAFPSGDTEPPTTDHFGCRCVLVPATAEDVGVAPQDVDLMAARLA